jgi:hydroxyethylthiazole kinase-like uncharacterized protein yjeF
MKQFDPEEIKKLYKPPRNFSGNENGQVTIIGGSSLFHGAPLLSLKVASRIMDMVFFSSPEPTIGHVAEQIKSKNLSFVWVPWEEVEDYIEKSDAVLIGPGFMRFHSEKTPHPQRHTLCDQACQTTSKITKDLLEKFPQKKWVIDAGSLQVMEPKWIPKGAILTPNKKEFSLLFGECTPQEAAKKHDCVIAYKGLTTIISSSKESIEVGGGNQGMTKGGTGDVFAGLAVSFLAKNEPFLAASCASYIIKKAAEELSSLKGIYYSAEDLANEIPKILNKFI